MYISSIHIEYIFMQVFYCFEYTDTLVDPPDRSYTAANALASFQFVNESKITAAKGAIHSAGGNKFLWNRIAILHSNSATPVISVGCGIPSNLSIVGAMSASLPPSRRFAFPAPMRVRGTGFVV